MLNISEKIPSDFRGCIIAALTDEFIVNVWPMDNETIENKEGKVLELRIFNTEVEYKWTRTSIGEDFSFRKRDDFDERMETFDQNMLLDVNTKKELHTPGIISTATGGEYFCPVSISSGKSPAVKVRYYVPKYDSSDLSTMHSRVVDWRLVEFTEQEDK